MRPLVRFPRFQLLRTKDVGPLRDTGSSTARPEWDLAEVSPREPYYVARVMTTSGLSPNMTNRSYQRSSHMLLEKLDGPF
jgi:hypothetical protein